MKNKARAVYLLKQRKDFEEQVSNLNTRKQAVIKTLNLLAQQQMDLDVFIELFRWLKCLTNQINTWGKFKMNWKEKIGDRYWLRLNKTNTTQ